MKEITDAQFKEEVLDFKGIVLVDFWAPWCGPCRMVGPVLQEISDEQASIKIIKINIDENPETANLYKVRAIPTLMYFNGGKLIETNTGFAAKDVILKKLESI